MELGWTIFPTDYAMPFHELAVEVEARGFESLWVAEHSHIPTSRRSPWPGGADLPKMYYDTLDPFVALAAAAARTERLRLGTGICLVIQRDPIHTAKEVASIDQVSGGRFLFGVGGGWNAEEMENHGTPFEGRFKLLRERIEAMQAIWTNDEAAYHGERVDFDPIFMWPKPVQQAASADPRRRRLSGRGAACGALRERLDPDRRAGRRPRECDPGIPADGRGRGPRPVLARGEHLRCPGGREGGRAVPRARCGSHRLRVASGRSRHAAADPRSGRCLPLRSAVR